MINYTIRPIGGIWPGRRTLSGNRKRSPFKTVYGRVLSDLERELKALKAREIVFRLEVSEYHIRQDGQLRSDARVTDPGIIVEFNADKIAGSPRLRYKCGYRRKLLYALFSFIRYLREEAVLDRNPIDDITRPKKGKKRTRWETEENDVRIVKAATIEYQGLFAFIKATGAEVSPATELAAREIDLWPEDDERYCGLAHIPGTKTETRDRHDALIEKWARPFIAAALHGKLPNAKVWPGISRHMAHWHHQKAAAVVEVLDYTLRDARHSWAVRGRKSNPQVTFEAIAEQLGNTVAVVADVYAEYKMSPAERRSGGVSAAKTATKPLRSLRRGKR